MRRVIQFATVLFLCCAMTFSASAQRKGKDQGNQGGKETRDIQREPKGDRGNGGGSPRGDSGGRGDNGGNRGGNGNNGGGNGGKHGNRPHDFR